MKKILLLLFGILVAIPALTQQLAEVSKVWITKNIHITDGHVEKWIIPDNQDTARYFHADGKRYLVTATFTEIKDSPEIVTIIDNVHSSNVYSSGWTHHAGTTWLQAFNDKTGSISYIIEGTLSTPFDGYKIEWWTEKRFNHGKVAVSIDGVLPEIVVDLYDPTGSNNSQKVFEQVVPQGAHIIRLRLMNEKNPAATQMNIIHDTFVTYKKQ